MTKSAAFAKGLFMNEDKHNMDAKGFNFPRFRKKFDTRHDIHRRVGVYTIQEEEVSDETQEQETQEKACSKEEQEEPVESE